jgi:hypothetical protein
MAATLGELVLVLGLLYGFYRVLLPFQRRVEAWLLAFLGAPPPPVDAEIVDDKKKNRRG